MGVGTVIVAFTSEDIIEGSISALKLLPGQVRLVDEYGDSAHRCQKLSQLAFEASTNKHIVLDIAYSTASSTSTSAHGVRTSTSRKCRFR
jgi:outer membrane protease